MELFIKRFIDLLDEEVPVSMVHTMVEQPLGAVMNDSYVVIHARQDLVDEESPFVEIEVYPITYKKARLLFAFTFPETSIRIDLKQFEEKLKQNKNLRVDKIESINDNETFYELFAETEWDIPDNNAEVDQVIVKIIEYVEEWMSSGGYKAEVE